MPTYKATRCPDTPERHHSCKYGVGIDRCKRRFDPGRDKKIPCDCWQKRPAQWLKPAAWGGEQ